MKHSEKTLENMKRQFDETFGKMTMYDTIVAFHEKFGIEMPEEPIKLPNDVSEYRIGFMQEELDEYVTSIDLSEKIDALVDLVVVAMGTAYMHGFDWDAHWELVYEKNMQKRRAKEASESKRGHSLDIIKPREWTPPDHEPIIDDTLDGIYYGN